MISVREILRCIRRFLKKGRVRADAVFKLRDESRQLIKDAGRQGAEKCHDRWSVRNDFRRPRKWSEVLVFERLDALRGFLLALEDPIRIARIRKEIQELEDEDASWQEPEGGSIGPAP